LSDQIDFNKAYDKVQWNFKQQMFIKMGYSTHFVKVLKTLTVGSQLQLLINGKCGPLFDITQSVRQGCPLSTLLFIFIIHCLSRCTSGEQLAGNIRGDHLPGTDVEHIQASYADDTHLVLAADTSNSHLFAAKEIFRRFSSATGLTLNWRKSEAWWLAEYQRPFPQTQGKYQDFLL
jgi:hypothetical protein